MRLSLRVFIQCLLILTLILPVSSIVSETPLDSSEEIPAALLSSQEELIQQIGNWTLGPMRIMEYHENAIYLGCNYGLLIIDISNPEDPVEVDIISFSNYIIDINVEDNLLFVSLHRYGLHILDITNPLIPIEVSQFSLPLGSIGSQIKVIGNIAYYLNNGRLQILDTNDINNITQISSFSLPGYDEMVVLGNYVYALNLNKGFVIIDKSNPLSPILINNITAYSRLTSLDVNGNYVYLTSENGNFTILDCTDVENVQESGATSLSYPWTVTILGGFALVGTRGSGLFILDIEDHTNITETGFYYPAHWIHEIAIDGDYTFLASEGKGLHIINTTTAMNTEGLTEIENAISIVPGFDEAYDIDVQSGIAYVAGLVSGLTILNVSDPTNPFRVNGIDYGESVSAVSVYNDLLYITLYSGTLRVLNISDSINPVIISDVSIYGSPSRISISDSIAAVAAGNQWSLINITDPYAMNVTATVTGFNTMREIAISQNLVFVSAQDMGFYIYDISDPYSPALLDHVTFSGEIVGFAVSDEYVYVAHGNGLDVINVSNPNSASNLGHFDLGNGRFYTISGNKLYMGMYQAFGVADISNPATPSLIDADYSLQGWRTDVVFDGLCYVIDNYLGVFCFDFDDDEDGLSNYEEGKYGTNPNDPDSDNDYLDDGPEIHTYLTDPLDPDSDNDLLLDGSEIWIYQTDPNNPDSDEDTISDYDEIQVYLTNPNNPDSDYDNITDPVEINTYGTDPNNNDTDIDFLNDYDEIFVYFTDPLDNDTDNDLMLDGLEILSGLDPLTDDGTLDHDSDGLSNLEEITHSTDPYNPDSDADTLSDYDEVYVYFTNPTLNDTDSDMLGDAEEVFQYLTDPNNNDTDSDLLSDGLEILIHLTNPNSSDSDGDSLSDYEEVATYGTNPNSRDSDNDTLDDADELLIHGTNPLSADSDSDGVDDALELLFGLNPTAYQEGGLLVQIFNTHWLLISLIMGGIVTVSGIRYSKQRGHRKREGKLAGYISGMEQILETFEVAGTTEDVNNYSTSDIEKYYLEVTQQREEAVTLAELMGMSKEVTTIQELQELIEKEYQEANNRIRASITSGRAKRTRRPGEVIDATSGIEVLRGCEIVGGTFEYKVKIQNNSTSVITNIKVNIITYPEESLKVAGENIREVSRIEIGGFRSLLFRFAPTKDCVEGKIVANVTFLDYQDEIHILEVAPYTIRSVCDLLKPLEIELVEFKQILDGMGSSQDEQVVDWNPEVLYIKTKQMMQSKNFQIISSEEHTSDSNYMGTIRGFA
ncbi:MAG: hypothetical protein ACTSQZ_00580, partial [Candidatus Thorarchaeota archaeon]